MQQNVVWRLQKCLTAAAPLTWVNIIATTALYRFFPPDSISWVLTQILHYHWKSSSRHAASGLFFGIVVVSLLLLCFVSDAVVAAERFEPTSVLAELFVYFLLCLCSMLSWNWKRPLCVNSCLLAGPGQYIREGLSINAQLYSVVHGPMRHRFRLMNTIGCGRQCNDASSHYIGYCLLLFAMLISFCVCVCFLR